MSWVAGAVHRRQGGFASTVAMGGDVGGEGVQCTAGQPGGSVGVTARAAAVDEVDHPANLVDEAVVDSAVGEIVEEPGQLGQAVAAWAALARAPAGEVAEDVCGAGESALVGWQRVDDAGTGAGTEVGQAGTRQPGAGDHCAGNPTAVVSAQQYGAKRAGLGDTEVPDEVGQPRSSRH